MNTKLERLQNEAYRAGRKANQAKADAVYARKVAEDAKKNADELDREAKIVLNEMGQLEPKRRP